MFLLTNLNLGVFLLTHLCSKVCSVISYIWVLFCFLPFFVFDRRIDTSEYVFAYSEVKLNYVASGAFFAVWEVVLRIALIVTHFHSL